MLETVLFIALPYVAIVVCIVGSIYRVRTAPMSYSSLSSQFLENKALVWGSVPWHIGIILILLAHIIVFVAPGPWKMLVSVKPLLLAIEITGIALSIGCLVGLVVLVARRIVSARVQAVSTTMDFVVLGLLLAQVALGLGVAVHYKWGAAWAPGTMTPYLWSLLTLQPDISVVREMPLALQAHIVGAWLILLALPFSRLIHMLALPVHYLFRPPQQVIWNTVRRAEAAEEHYVDQEARRNFIYGSIGIAAGAALLGIGTMDKAFRFFFGPRLTKEQESEMMELRLKRLQATADQRKLELERQTSQFILVAALSDLKPTEGKYFIDYEMRPALAFKGSDGLPIILSAKCTHLGCTVGNQVNDQGKILCPCHVSFFDIKTGEPNADAPAKAPLPILGWVIMDGTGNKLAERDRKGMVTMLADSAKLASANVYISRAHAEAAS